MIYHSDGLGFFLAELHRLWAACFWECQLAVPAGYSACMLCFFDFSFIFACWLALSSQMNSLYHTWHGHPQKGGFFENE